nr:uncharacterized protein LOC106617016 isoform X1 [Bactrocera oleae]XP_014089448.1 uncharacterized protein LOC106617016 isoform X1 [Bactrocera oleae]XP_014089449.1 uncharacterized protein LOC106617016 isoform X1 [Bactrocera oleae]XP_014089451.1 uncharacterized protein LOC106617016 isoform X1 [Bactrocera oleae]XP_036230022.1 uncharacterized protein LOC106617016 isoform X1 [Bactrocera oleae]XP_036230023.1 uncharacterized protein LOC106617016 isoform X1 [Bactrocera oleae]XP_036230024.1 uncharac
MHRSLKPHAQAKKVPPPALPGDPAPQQQQIPLYRLGGSISSAAGKQLDDGIIMSSMVSSPSLEEGGFNLPREPSVALRMKDEISEYATVMSTSGTSQSSGSSAGTAAAGKQQAANQVATGGATLLSTATNPLLSGCPPTIVPCPPPVFCATLREPLTHKAAVYYHQQLALQEDQGIDLTQSPGRDSPGSSSGSAGSGSRHSTASLDSGRASSYLTGVSGASIRGSAGGALSSPRCSSVSSCSIGSVDRQRNDELIIDWLMEMKYEEYAQLFIAAGYDLPTIARMTPEDLTAIGIKNPHHRERIKQRIDKLQVLDNLPHFVPGSIEEWLQLLRLEEYIQPLLDQNYKTVRDVTQVTWEDLEDIGIVKLGHQKKILLAIKRVKDIISGKWNPGGINAYQQQDYRNKIWPSAVPMPTTPTYLPTTRVSWDDSKIYATPGVDAVYFCNGAHHECCNGNDVVPIKVRQPRGKSLESLEDIHDNSTRSHLTFSHYTATDYGHFAHPTPAMQQQHHQQALQHQQQQQAMQQHHQAAMMGGTVVGGPGGAGGARLLSNQAAMSWRRSYDDGDITPTNDAARELMYEEGGGTLPRQQRGILQRAVLNSMPPLEHHYMNAAAAAEYVCHAGGLGGVGVPGATAHVGATGPTGCVLDSAGLNTPYLTGSPMSNKKIAPEPPRRHCSIRNSRTLSADSAQQQQQLQQQQQMGLHVGAAVTPGLYYGGAGALHHGGMYMTHAQQQAAAAAATANQPIYANYATIQQTTAEIHCEKFHDNKSNSSIDSIDTIPFANENTGTIKQRLLNRQDIGGPQQPLQSGNTPHLHSSSSSSSSSSTNTIANIAHSFHSLKTSASLHDASLIRSDSIGSTTSGGSAGASTGGGGSNSLLLLRSPTLQYPPTDVTNAVGGSSTTITTTVDLHTPSDAEANTDAAGDGAPLTGSEGADGSGGTAGAGSTTIQTPGQKVSVNVLNDIGNMLANLTDELDAMLEEEKRIGLNIDSE